MQQSVRITAYFSAMWFFVLSNTAWAESLRELTAPRKDCPAQFDVVDLGKWEVNEDGDNVLDYGGVLYRVTSTSDALQDLIDCIAPEDLGGRVQLLDGKPVPLARSIYDRDLGFRYYRRPSGDFMGDWVAGSIKAARSQGPAGSGAEIRNREDFALWLATANENGKAVASGADYTCIFDPENPDLSGYGNYTCLVTFDNAPLQDAYLHCSEWGGRCFAEFTLSPGMEIRLQAPYLPRWEAASRVKTFPEALRFWSELIFASIESFNANVVPRGREEIQQVGD